MSEDKNDKDYVNEIVWKDYKAGDNVTGILVDVLENMGEYGNRIYKIRTDDAFVAFGEVMILTRKWINLK